MVHPLRHIPIHQDQGTLTTRFFAQHAFCVHLIYYCVVESRVFAAKYVHKLVGVCLTPLQKVPIDLQLEFQPLKLSNVIL
jgi:hypothetical protein